MKVIGIYLIIAGHFTPPHFNIIYVFSVQVFLMISGFLSHAQSDRKFYTGILRNLVTPMLIICVLNVTFDFCLQLRYGIYHIQDYLCKLLGILWGDHRSLGACWFIYTLINIKIIDHYSNKITKILLFISSLSLLTIYHHMNLSYSNAIINTLVCYPVFCIGVFLQRLHTIISGEVHRSKLFFVALLCMVIIYLCSKYNSVPWMWQNQFGNNLPIFLVGSIAGTGCLFCISKILESKFNNFITMLADGNIIVLGFHFTLICYFFHYDLHYYYYIIALLVLVSFYPLIILTKKYFPVILGTRARNC